MALYEEPKSEHLYSIPQRAREPSRVRGKIMEPEVTTKTASPIRTDPNASPPTSPFREFIQREKAARDGSKSPNWKRTTRITEAEPSRFQFNVETEPQLEVPVSTQQLFSKAVSEGGPRISSPPARLRLRAEPLAFQKCKSSGSEVTPSSSPVFSSPKISRCSVAISQEIIFTDEFTVRAGEEVVVLDQPGFKPVMNRQGKIGFVPESAITATNRWSDVDFHQDQICKPPTLKWTMSSYFHEHITRSDAEAKLAPWLSEDGTFLLRLKEQSSISTTYALSVTCSGSIEHDLIEVSTQNQSPVLLNGKQLLTCFTLEDAITFFSVVHARGSLMPPTLRRPIPPVSVPVEEFRLLFF